MQKSILFTVRMVAATMIAGSLVPQASSQSLYWDANGTDPGAGATPTGIWGTDLFWNSVLDGTGTPGAWVSGNTAVFSAGGDATGAFTVTVGSAQTVGNITVEEGAVTMAGTAALTLNGGAIFDIANGSSFTIPNGTVPLSAAGGFKKTGAGILTIGTSTTALGAVDILGGVLSTDVSGRLSGSGTITIDGAIMRDTGQANGSSFQAAAHPIIVGPNGARFETLGGFGVARLYQGTI